MSKSNRENHGRKENDVTPFSYINDVALAPIVENLAGEVKRMAYIQSCLELPSAGISPRGVGLVSDFLKGPWIVISVVWTPRGPGGNVIEYSVPSRTKST